MPTEVWSSVVRATVLVSLIAAAGLAGSRSASAQTPCWRTVIEDWSDGTISGGYPVACYRQALHRMPEDVRLYSTAAADINRALASRIRSMRRSAAVSSTGAVSRSSAAAGPGGDGGQTSAPLILGVGLGALLAVLAAGGLAAGRKLRPDRSRHRLRSRR